MLSGTNNFNETSALGLGVTHSLLHRPAIIIIIMPVDQYGNHHHHARGSEVGCYGMGSLLEGPNPTESRPILMSARANPISAAVGEESTSHFGNTLGVCYPVSVL